LIELIHFLAFADKPSDFSSCPPALVVNIFAEKQSKVKDSEPKSESAPEIAEKAQQSVQEKADLLDYLIREDGSVVCKICGEILSSRTHWYRHKYKIHNPTSASSSPSAIFQCDQCNAFFKSRKGYFGHLASRHSSAHEALPAQVTVKEEAFPEGVKEIIFRNSWEKQRKRDEQLVAEIIDRVKKECEAQGATESRKGYNRRSTVMNTS
ncbi:uncharacterized protein LOC132263831, partial [Phlebotomus argentipes]|uniref:uncharacterized protein LOC132263831 n=1 Tax=Phlebotomus argentipes TaxID=94469 RepID=UPI002892C47A